MSDSNHLSSLLSKIIGKMLKPLVKLLMLNNITYTGLLSLLKQTFVKVAAEEQIFHLDNKKQTDSRISLLTGVHRKEVKRIRENMHDSLSESELTAGLSAQMMSRWLGHQSYLDTKGKPLPLHKQHDSERSFEQLVFDISKDKHPRSILDDWLKQNLVRIDDENMIHLLQNGYIAQDNFEEKLFFAGKNISQHLDAVTNNLTPNSNPRFDRAVYYHNLSPDSATKIEQLAQHEMLKVLTLINKKAADLQSQDALNTDTKNIHSIHLGAYFNGSQKKGDNND